MTTITLNTLIGKIESAIEYSVAKNNGNGYSYLEYEEDEEIKNIIDSLVQRLYEISEGNCDYNEESDEEFMLRRFKEDDEEFIWILHNCNLPESLEKHLQNLELQYNKFKEHRKEFLDYEFVIS